MIRMTAGRRSLAISPYFAFPYGLVGGAAWFSRPFGTLGGTMRRLVRLCLAAASFCLAMCGAEAAMAACQITDDAAFSDKFDVLDPTWGEYENYKVEDGKLVINPPAGYNTSTINTASLYDDVDVCVDMTALEPVNKGTCGSIIVWAIDYDNYYSFQVSTEGEASFWRRQRGRWLSQVGWQAADGYNKDTGAVNELKVVTEGNMAKLYLNGKLFKEVRGQPPKDGQQVGLLACSPNDEAARVGFDDFVVNDVKKAEGGK
jgi:hypothetical protein